MANPYTVLGAQPQDSDEVIRQQYLKAVRQHPPGRCPEDFRRVHEAYALIKDEESRLAFLLFDPTQGETLDDLIAEEEACNTRTQRVGLSTMLKMLDLTR
jgi:curved DNA-binding protein CbpA